MKHSYLYATLPFLFLTNGSYAQGVQANVVAACGTPNSTYTAGQNKPATQDTTGNLCVGAVVNVGSVVISGGTLAVTQATSPWVVSGTVAVTGTPTIGGTVTLAAGTAIAGKFGIDQTTPGTTNGVVINSGTVATTQVTSPWVVGGTVAATQSGTWTGVTIVPSGTQTVTGTVAATQSGNWLVQGITATGSAVAGNPLLNGGRAASTVPTAVADGAAVPIMVSLEGKLINVPFAPKELMVRGSAVATGTTAVSVLAATVGLKTYVTGAQCYRTDAGTVTADVTLSDSLSTALVLPVGGGSNVTFTTPLVTSTTSAAVTMTPSAALSSVKCMLQGYSGAFLLDGDMPDLNHGHTGAFLVASEESDFLVAA